MLYPLGVTSPLHPEVQAWLREEHGAPGGSALLSELPFLRTLGEEQQKLATEVWPVDGFTPDYCVDFMRPPREWQRGSYDVEGLGAYLQGLGWILIGTTGGCGDFLLVKSRGVPTVGFGHMPLIVDEEKLETGAPPEDGAIVESSVDIYNLLERLMAQFVGLDVAFDPEPFQGRRAPSFSFVPSATDAWELQDEETGVAVLPHFSWAQVRG